MKKTSIQSKILFMSIVLVLMTTFGLSWRYYTLILHDKRQEFQRRIQIAFDIIWDDYETRMTSLTNRVQEFVTAETLAATTARYLEDPERLQSIAFVTTNLVRAAEELQRFGQANAAQRLLLYGADKRLLAAYHSAGDVDAAGMCVQIAGTSAALIPVDDADRVTAMFLGREAIPEVPLLQALPILYPADIPDTVTTGLFSEETLTGVRVLAPIFLQEQLTGLLVADMAYTQALVERYAGLTQTAVNVFSGARFSVGTLRAYPVLESGHPVLCSALRQRTVPLKIVPVTAETGEYYQGSCGLPAAAGQPAITFAAHLDKTSENAMIQQFFTAALYAIAVVLSMTLVLSWFFSRKISRPIRAIAQHIHHISAGDLRGIDLSYAQPEAGPVEQPASVLGMPPQSDIFAQAQFAEDDEIGVLTRSFYALAQYLHNMAEVAQKISRGDIAQTIAPRSEHDTLGVAFQQMLAYIRDITDLARDLADGNLLVEAQPRSDHDILNHSLRKMLIYIQGVANVAESIADGNLQVKVEPKSELDVLNQALQRMMAYIHSVADITERIAANDMQVLVSPKSDRDVLNISLYRMVLNLQTARERAEQSMAAVEQQNWLKTGQAELSNVMRGEQNIAMLAKHIIAYLAAYLDAQVGLLYVAEERDGEAVLQLAGTYAYTTRKGHRSEFQFGDGLVGQAALEQESLLFSDIPDGYITITSGIGEMTPQNILVTPFVYEGVVKGVIELGTIYAFTDIQREFLALACENIAIAVHTAQARVRMHHLLAETQHQSEALQAQQEELRQSNAELEARTHALLQSEAKLQAQQEELQRSNTRLQAQAEALKMSEEKLQAQQEELRQTNEELEANARQLEKQQSVLTQKNFELEQSQKMLEEKAHELELTSRYKSEFLANMSHELRTPLNSVLILSKLLHDNKEGNLTAKQKKSAQMIYQAVMNWIDLIDNILDVSELETGKMTARYETVHRKTVSTFLEQHFRKACQEKGLAFHLEVDQTLPETICTDWKRLEQILKNLVSNAVKFTDQGEVRIALGRPAPETRFTNPDLQIGRTLAITVTDTGSGIPAEQLAGIFEAFHQADGSMTRQHGGTGLGLSISQKLAALLGGEIQVQSEVGRGSVFTVYLPEQQMSESIDGSPSVDGSPTVQAAAVPAPEPDARRVHTTSAILLAGGDADLHNDDEHNAVLQGKTILVVDDDVRNLYALTNALEDYGLTVLMAINGKNALEQLAEHAEIALVVMDIMMPEMDGYETMHAIRAHAEFSELPIMALTAKAMQPEHDKCRAAGANDYLTKPVDLKQFVSRLRVWLSPDRKMKSEK